MVVGVVVLVAGVVAILVGTAKLSIFRGEEEGRGEEGGAVEEEEEERLPLADFWPGRKGRRRVKECMFK